MSKKISLNIGGTNFDLNVDEQFSVYIEHQIAKDFKIDGNNDLKTLLQAYVRKTYELYTQEQKIDEILKKIEK